MTPGDNTALWLGLWGTLLSTVLAVLRLREFFADRGRLEFRATVQRTYNPSPPGADTTHHAPSEPRVVFTVTNVGRRKLRIMGFGVRIGWYWKRPRRRDREIRMHQTSDFPRDLGEGETMEFDDPIYQAQLKHPHVAAFVYDSLGGRWELPSSDLSDARHPKVELPSQVFQRRSGKAS
jgi:hypothetical protein